MKKVFVSLLLLSSSVSFANPFLKCDLVDYSDDSKLIGHLEKEIPSDGKLSQVYIADLNGIKAEVSFVQLLGEDAAKMTMKVNDSEFSGVILTNSINAVNFKDSANKVYLSLECAVRK